MKKRTKQLMLASLLGVSMIGTTVSAASYGVAYNATTNYQHGSSIPVSESQLKTTVPYGYDVNDATQASAKKGLYERLFEEESVEELNITVDENNWNYLLQHANKEPYVLADRVSIGGDSVDYVGLKTKGNYTLLTAWQSDTDRFSFGINVGKYIKKANGYSDTQNFYGLKKFSLNNVTGDATYLKEYLSYKLFREMGVPAPYCSLVKLCINGQYWGVYSLIENIDSPLYKRSTSFKDVDLYKCDKQGGSLVYSNSFDSYLDGSRDFDLKNYAQQGNVLANYTGLWDNQQSGTTIEDYQEELAKAKTQQEIDKVNSTTGKEVKDNIIETMTWMKKLNQLNQASNANTASYEAAAEEILDVDAVLKYFAANTFLVSLDSYQSDEAHNYCIGMHDGKAFALPWDYNYSFGAFDIYSTSEYINFNIDKPVVRVNIEQRPLLNVLLKNDNFRARYEQYLLDCCKIACTGGTVTGTDLKGETYSRNYAPNYFESIIRNFQEGELGATLRQTPVEKPFYSYDQYMNSCSAFARVIGLRATAVMNQVNDDFTKVSDEGIRMSTFGFTHAFDFGGGGNWGWPGGDWNWPWGGQVTTSPSPSPSKQPSPSPSLSPSPSVNPSPSPSLKPTSTPTTIPTTKVPVSGDASVKVQLSGQTADGSNTIGGSITLNTTSNEALDLSKLTVKYYYSADSSASQNVWIDSAAMQYNRAPWYAAVTSDTTGTIVSCNTGNATADHYMQIAFSGTDKLEKDSTLTMSFRIANDNWSAINQKNDYSYGDAEHVVVMYDGKVVAGVTP